MKVKVEDDRFADIRYDLGGDFFYSVWAKTGKEKDIPHVSFRDL